MGLKKTNTSKKVLVYNVNQEIISKTYDEIIPDIKNCVFKEIEGTKSDLTANQIDIMRKKSYIKATTDVIEDSNNRELYSKEYKRRKGVELI